MPTDRGEQDTSSSLGMELELHQPSTLLTVLTTVARLGGTVTHLVALPGRARLAIAAPSTSAHRFFPVVRETIGVMAVAAIDPGLAQEATECAAGAKRAGASRDEAHVVRLQRRAVAAAS